MCLNWASTDLWGAWMGNHPGLPGVTPKSVRCYQNPDRGESLRSIRPKRATATSVFESGTPEPRRTSNSDQRSGLHPRHRKEMPDDVRREHHSEAEARVGPGACGRGVMKAQARHPSDSKGELNQRKCPLAMGTRHYPDGRGHHPAIPPVGERFRSGGGATAWAPTAIAGVSPDADGQTLRQEGH